MHTYGGTHGLQEQLPLGAQCVMLIIWKVWLPYLHFACNRIISVAAVGAAARGAAGGAAAATTANKTAASSSLRCRYFFLSTTPPTCPYIWWCCCFCLLCCCRRRLTLLLLLLYPLLFLYICGWQKKTNQCYFHNVTEKKWYGTPRGVVAPTQGPGEGPDSVLATSERVHLCTSDEVAFKFKSTFEIKTVQYILYRPPFFFFNRTILLPYGS